MTKKIKNAAKIIIPDQFEDEVESGLRKTRSFFQEFKEFAVKGNALDLAIGVVIGTAFKGIVDSLVNDIIMPLVGLATGNVDFSNMYLNLSNKEYETLAEAQEAGAAVITYGNLINAIINFILISLIIFLIVRYLISKKKEEVKEEKKTTKQCPFCHEDIKIEAIKCKFCTAKLEN